MLNIDHNKAFLRFVGILSVFGNSLLIFLIIRRQNQAMGNYRMLLVAFACCDIAISVVHAFAVPVIFQVKYGIIMFTICGLHEPYPLGFYINLSCAILLYEPFVLLAFHFVYRYLVLANSTFVMLCCHLTESDEYINSVMLDQFHTNMRAEPRPNMFCMQYINSCNNINWDMIVVAGVAFACMTTTFGVSAWCGRRIDALLSTRVMSIETRKMHVQLFRALVMQFMVPVVLYLLPIIFILILPFTGIQFGETGNVLVLVVSLFPVIDPIMVILMIARFRRTILQIHITLASKIWKTFRSAPFITGHNNTNTIVEPE